jgi:ATP-binding cassette subfamily F protein uup
MDGRELAGLPGQIEALEREQTEIVGRMGEPAYSAGGLERMQADGARLQEITTTLERLYARWEKLEAQLSAS